MPLFRDYPEAGSLEATDAFVIDRIGVGTMFIEGQFIGASQTRAITYVIDGGGSELSTGIAGDLFLPFDCTITAVTLLADQTGDVEVDIWWDLYSAYPPDVSDSIVASAPPTISADDHSQDSTLTGWTTVLNANSTLRFNVNSVTDITRLTIVLTAS